MHCLRGMVVFLFKQKIITVLVLSLVSYFGYFLISSLEEEEQLSTCAFLTACVAHDYLFLMTYFYVLKCPFLTVVSLVIL